LQNAVSAISGYLRFYAGMAGNAKDKDRVEFTRFKELK